MRMRAMLLVAPVIAACNPGPEDRADTQPPRPLPAHSVARAESGPQPDIPPPARLERGRQRYAIFCSPCHGDAGFGDGAVVARGFPAPPSFHDRQAGALDAAEIIGIIAEGRGRMLPMGDRVGPADRLAIALFVQSLQGGKGATAAVPGGASAR